MSLQAYPTVFERVNIKKGSKIMITNIQKVFVTFITLCCVGPFLSTLAQASPDARLTGSTAIVKKYRHGSNVESGGPLQRKKGVTAKKIPSQTDGRQNNRQNTNHWHSQKENSDQNRVEKLNQKQKQTDHHYRHKNSNQFSDSEHIKHNRHNGIHKHGIKNNFSPHHYSSDQFDHRRESYNSDKQGEHRGSSNHHKKSKKQIIVRHRHKHRPNYNIYKSHKYTYYRTPWYNTRFLAPIHYHYHPIGHQVNYLPGLHIRVVVNGLPYFYFGGVFYQSFADSYIVVGAPIGAIVQTLPIGFIAFSIGPITYYHVNDAYYIWDGPRQVYTVVEKPEGADEAIADATTGRLFVYPNEGQSEEQQAKDRYECHRWAVVESRVDPTSENSDLGPEEKKLYQRAIGACLEGRNYTVK